MGCTIDELNTKKQLAVQIWNALHVPIQQNTNIRLGQAKCLSTVMNNALDSTAAYALQTNADLLTLFRAGSEITLWGRAGQILPTSTVGYINPLNDLLVLRIYSQVNILDISSP